MYSDQIHRALGVYEHKNNVREHFYCVKDVLGLYKTKQQLVELSKRPDLETVCAFDYYKMKQYALEKEGLQYADYHPEIKGITVPTMESASPAAPKETVVYFGTLEEAHAGARAALAERAKPIAQ